MDLHNVIGVTDIMIVDTNEAILDHYRDVFSSYDNLRNRHSTLTVTLCVGSPAEPDCRVQDAEAVLLVDS